MSLFELSNSSDLQELLKLYNEVYGQLAALKHLIYSSTFLADPESVAAQFSQQMIECISPGHNAVWLTSTDGRLVETVRNGRLIAPGERQVMDVDSHEAIKRVVCEQLVCWGTDGHTLPALLRDFRSPDLFPIKMHNEPLGFLAVEGTDPSKREQLQFAAQFAGMILKIARLHQQGMQQRKDLEDITTLLLSQNTQLHTLHHTGMKIVEVSDSQRLCTIITESLVDELGAPGAAAFVFAEPGVLVCSAEMGGISGLHRQSLSMEEISVFKKAVESRRIISCGDYEEPLVLGENRIQNWVVFPFRGRERVLGVLVLDSGNLDINDPAAILVNQASMVLDNLVVLEESKRINALLESRTTDLLKANASLQEANSMLEQLSMIDYLTSLYNHRFFQERFEIEFSRAERYRTALALIMIDLDRFKWINDHYGHSAGDEVLRVVSRRIRERLRCSDVVARYGGDEFAVLLPDAHEEAACRVAKKLMDIVEANPILINGEAVYVGISCGVACYPSDGIACRQDLFNKADQALYRLKGERKTRLSNDETAGKPKEAPSLGIEPAASGSGIALTSYKQSAHLDDLRNMEELGQRIRDLEEECLGLIGYLDGRQFAEARLGLISRLNRLFATESDSRTLFQRVLNISLKATESSLGYFGYIDRDDRFAIPTVAPEESTQWEIQQGSTRFSKEQWDGLWGESLLRRTSVIAGHAMEAPAGNIRLERAMCTVMVFGDELLGQLCVANKPSDYTQSDLEILEDIARTLAPALKNWLEQERYRQSLEEMHVDSVRKNRDLEELNEIIVRQSEQIVSINQVLSRLSKTVSTDETCTVIIEALREHMGIEKALLAIKADNAGYRMLKEIGIAQLDSDEILHRLAHDEVAGIVLTSGRRVGKESLAGRASFWDGLFDDWMVWPLKGRRGVLGLVALDDPGPDQRDSLGILAGQGGIFIESAMLHEDLLTTNERLLEANTRLMHVDRQKSEFLSRVGHDLRTPLTSIRSYSELLLMYKDEPGHIREEFLNVISRESIRLEHLITGFRDFARMELGTMEYAEAPFDVAELITRTAMLFEGEAARRGMMLTVELEPDLPEIVGDRDRIMEALSNLFSNALKYTPDGGAISVWARQAAYGAVSCGVDPLAGRECGSSSNESLGVEVGIKDTGHGIDPAYHRRIFERFGQVDECPMKARGGTGLGLAIAKEIVEHHDGRIWVESEPGFGATFTFVVPCRSHLVKPGQADDR